MDVGKNLVAKGNSMTKWINISIIGVLVTGLAASLFLYFQESGNLRHAESEIVTLEEDMMAAEAQISTLEEKLAPVTFPDANLEAAIREFLNITTGEINKFHLESLTMLVAQDRGISDITGLELCVNLQRLDLMDNDISDISALAGLSNLGYLRLPDNNISDISALAGLTKLWFLSLWENNINDISALAGLTDLEKLYLWDNNISDISALTGLTKLDVLNLVDNNISDIGPLVANIGIATGDFLWLSGNPLNAISVNVYIPELELQEARMVTILYLY